LHLLLGALLRSCGGLVKIGPSVVDVWLLIFACSPVYVVSDRPIQNEVWYAGKRQNALEAG